MKSAGAVGALKSHRAQSIQLFVEDERLRALEHAHVFSACASLDPAAFKQAVYSFGGPFSKAPLRRLVRERARIYALLAEGGLPRPRRVEDSLADFCHAALQLLHDTQA